VVVVALQEVNLLVVTAVLAVALTQVLLSVLVLQIKDITEAHLVAAIVLVAAVAQEL
jgi:hypothetical protein